MGEVVTLTEQEKRGAAEPPLGELVKAAEVAEEPFSVDEVPLYAASKKVYPQGVKGTFRTIKWVVLAITLGIYYLLPFVRWDRGPNAPDQAVLIDLPGRRFYFFFIEIWPQEVYYLTGLLIIAAMALFLMNAVAGRVWCGYLCPQTVWTDLYLAVERVLEGDRRERMLTDAGPWTLTKIAQKATKHFFWLMIAWWTGGAWVLYFADAPTLVKELASGTAPMIAYIWIGILTFTTYALAGHMREQVCVYMCPWPRIQAALTDEYALNVAYRYDRGEPRASVKKSATLRAKGLPAGDCIDCLQCVHVCPTGVDIRNGPSLGCIQCGLCIDACDAVMAKIGRPTRLIAYDTDINIRHLERKGVFGHIVRPRTLIYAAIIVLVSAIMIYTLATRSTFGLNVIHDRNPMFVRLSDGSVRNGYTIHVMNKNLEERTYRLSIDGLAGGSLDIVDEKDAAAKEHDITVGPDQTREVRALVRTQAPLSPGASLPLTFRLTDPRDGRELSVTDKFRGP
jgi:cytochrome c oxidase accessory protein FixG